jgi:hypothetical protein
MLAIFVLFAFVLSRCLEKKIGFYDSDDQCSSIMPNSILGNYSHLHFQYAAVKDSRLGISPEKETIFKEFASLSSNIIVSINASSFAKVENYTSFADSFSQLGLRYKVDGFNVDFTIHDFNANQKVFLIH